MAVSTGIRVAVLPDIGSPTDDTTVVAYKGGVGDLRLLNLAGYVRGDVAFYGAKGDGTTNAAPAILAMQSAAGRVVFPAGTFRISSTMTVTVPMHFAPGAKLLIDNGAILYFQGKQIDAPRQLLFTGAGVMRFQPGGAFSLGDPIFPEWWGVSGVAGNMANPGIQAMSDACSALTEWHATFVGGLYRVAQTVTFGRGAFIQGLGNTRRVVFQPIFADGDVFHFLDSANRIEGIQFETRSGFVPEITSGACIRCDVGQTIVRDINGGGFTMVKLGGNQNLVQNVNGGISNLAGSSVVELTGSENVVSEIRGATPHPESSVVRVTSGSNQDISQVTNTGALGFAVDIDIDSFGYNYNVRGVISRGQTATVRLRSRSGGTLSLFNVDGILTGPRSGAIGVLVHSDGGVVTDGAITGVQMRSSTAVGVEFRRSGAQALDRVSVSSSSLRNATTPVLQVGSPTNIVIDGTVFV